MKRDLVQLASGEYDVLVIGGGIYGACVAWDATLRGLSVALIDKGDFGHATSANSLKIIHGGLRYLQDANLGLVRTMITERTTWMRIAPHLVHPLPCLTPTYRKPTRSRTALAAALMINDLMSYDRNRLKDGGKHIPGGRTLSRDECLELLPGSMADGITGGALWYDAQMYNSERLLLSFVLAAAEAGAEVANYVEASSFLWDDTTVRGVTAKDVLTGEDVEIRAKLVVNSAGAWVDSLLSSFNNHPTAPKFHLSTALNLITRQVLTEYAVGITGRYTGQDEHGNPIRRSRMLFITPWRQYSIIGTIHAPYSGRPDAFPVTEEVIEGFIDEINAAYPGAALAPQDVHDVHWGFLPMANHSHYSDAVKLVRQGRVYDHERDDGIKGLITVVGVKYTTARDVAQKVVDLAVEKLGHKTPPCQTHTAPVYGGQIERFDDFVSQAAQENRFGLAPEVTQHLAYSYGSEYHRVLEYLDEEPTWGQTVGAGSPVLKAEVVHAAREEMAQKLTDVVQRRTELGADGPPDEATLGVCADLVADELGWSQLRKEREVDEVRSQAWRERKGE